MAEQIKIKKPPVSERKLDISEATIIKPEDEKTTNSDNVKDAESYVKNLNDQKTIDLGETGKKQAGEKVVIDFMNEDHVKDFTSSETKKAEDLQDDSDLGNKSNFSGESVDDLKKKIKDEEEKSVKNFTAKDFEDVARFIIFLIDASFSSFFKWWGKDTSDTAYSLPKGKQETLVYQLTLILVKYQAKFSIEFMFLISLLVLYAPAFVKSKNSRKASKGETNFEELPTFVTPSTTFTDQINKDVETQKSEKVEIKTNTGAGTKRRRGNPGKA